ncbi:MAG: hypothetical protein ACK5W9_07045 [Bdellovibrionales bacterium]
MTEQRWQRRFFIKDLVRYKRLLVYVALCSAILLSSTIPEIDFCSSRSAQLNSVGVENIRTVTATLDENLKPDSTPINRDEKSAEEHLFCHLGHTCRLVINRTVYFQLPNFTSVQSEFLILEFQEPELDGPFRPPKLPS